MNKKAVILLSGGIDSSTTLAIARVEGYELYAISFDYHQKHRIELESARKVAALFPLKRYLVVRFDLRDIGGSALTSAIPVPKAANSKNEVSLHEKRDSSAGKKDHLQPVPVTYVPARNTIFLSFALSWAEVLEAENIFIGANAVDYSGYPDCRPDYLSAFEIMANLATKASVEGVCRFSIKAPLISMKKSEIVKKGRELGLDYSLTWSCYDPQPLSKDSVTEAPAAWVPCLMCDSCRLRQKGFSEAGLSDPLHSLLNINET